MISKAIAACFSFKTTGQLNDWLHAFLGNQNVGRRKVGYQNKNVLLLPVRRDIRGKEEAVKEILETLNGIILYLKPFNFDPKKQEDQKVDAEIFLQTDATGLRVGPFFNV